ncbi:hypothetical protein [Deinococcus maricopensis]|uniref:Uncharacterized protein n=1 Tax=Deinococcus maricopensis (strain DSM 21211 / LMG 22137 / NRRL B-23946 / LB-34) TaxID=709986 RepID=E8U9S6_DEIML|nr:hypothetical protein [Deinococcus maricopensis]ADV67815.1 hypothetical protein Deima_2175 [Deinococcus maricopensis DSM 21211]
MTLNITPLYAVAVLLIALYLTGRYVRETARGRTPRLAWLAPAGILTLLLAPVLDAPPLFGLGVVLLLAAEYLPGAYLGWGLPRRAPQPVGGAWAITSALLILMMGLSAQREQWLFAAGAALVLAAVLVRTLAVALRERNVARAWRDAGRPVGLALRFSSAVEPLTPDLELELTGDAARVRNVGAFPVTLHGWTPTAFNAYLPALPETLPVGEQATLTPWPAGNSGLRIWYTRAGEPTTYLYRANWTPPEGLPADARVLN